MIKTITFLAAMLVGSIAVAQNNDPLAGINYVLIHNTGKLIVLRDDTRSNDLRSNAAAYCEAFKEKGVRSVKVYGDTSGTVVRENATDSSLNSPDKGYVETNCP